MKLHAEAPDKLATAWMEFFLPQELPAFIITQTKILTI